MLETIHPRTGSAAARLPKETNMHKALMQNTKKNKGIPYVFSYSRKKYGKMFRISK